MLPSVSCRTAGHLQVSRAAPVAPQKLRTALGRRGLSTSWQRLFTGDPESNEAAGQPLYRSSSGVFLCILEWSVSGGLSCAELAKSVAGSSLCEASSPRCICLRRHAALGVVSVCLLSVADPMPACVLHAVRLAGGGWLEY